MCVCVRERERESVWVFCVGVEQDCIQSGYQSTLFLESEFLFVSFLKKCEYFMLDPFTGGFVCFFE